jgi:hypothetical protein
MESVSRKKQGAIKTNKQSTTSWREWIKNQSSTLRAAASSIMRGTLQPASHSRSQSRNHLTPRDSEEVEERIMNYQSFPDSSGEDTYDSHNNNHTASRATPPSYRGFTTSITDMFTDPAHEGTDCCALACCGVLQSDRDRYLITGTRPPGCFKRFWMHFVLPATLFLLAIYCAFQVPDPLMNSLACTTLLFAFLGYFVTQCFKGTMKRQQVRKELLWNRYHLLVKGVVRHRTDEDSMDEAMSGRVPVYFMGQTLRDMSCAHSPFGCYASDRRMNDRTIGGGGGDNPVDGSKTPTLCRRFFECFMNACCGVLCGMHVQICGLCALGQESRELQAIMPPGYARVDYITMQPMMDYYPAIYEARHTTGTPSTYWWIRLSSLSKWILAIALGDLLALLGWSLISERVGHHFGPLNFAVLCATVFQALILLWLVHWNHTKDVSSDALIKCFVCGFCLCTTLAIFFELVVGLTIRLSMSIIMSLAGVDVVSKSVFSDTLLLAMPGFGNAWMAMQETGTNKDYRDFLQAFGEDHPVFYTVYLFINAFFLAAMIEELVKYFGFRMIDHPDFLTKRQLEECADFGDERNQDGMPAKAPAFPEHHKCLQSRGATITVAMVAVSLGFACAENLVYVFIYGETTVTMEAVVLIARSLFPVHPLAAAIQSIRVCSRDMEKVKHMRVGRIILPAVMFHGSYDFFLMWIAFVRSRKGNFSDDDTVVDDISSSLFSVIASVCILAVALFFYVRQSKKQRERLQQLDHRSVADHSRLV